MVDPQPNCRRVLMKLSEKSCLRWRCVWGHPVSAPRTSCFIQSQWQWVVVHACCCRIHSGKISFYNKIKTCVVAFVLSRYIHSMINCRNKFLCLGFLVSIIASLLPPPRPHLSSPRLVFDNFDIDVKCYCKIFGEGPAPIGKHCWKLVHFARRAFKHCEKQWSCYTCTQS